jgi:hypothetical protein
MLKVLFANNNNIIKNQIKGETNVFVECSRIGKKLDKQREKMKNVKISSLIN